MAFAFLPTKEDMLLFRVHLLVVASKNTSDQLKAAILSSDMIENKPYNLRVHQTEACSSIPESANLHVDFVVFVVDCRDPDAVKKVMQDVKSLPPELSFGRFCVINAAFKNTQFSGHSKLAENLESVFKVNFNAHILNGRFDAEDDIADVASRVIRLMSMVVNLP